MGIWRVGSLIGSLLAGCPRRMTQVEDPLEDPRRMTRVEDPVEDPRKMTQLEDPVEDPRRMTPLEDPLHRMTQVEEAKLEPDVVESGEAAIPGFMRPCGVGEEASAERDTVAGVF